MGESDVDNRSARRLRRLFTDDTGFTTVFVFGFETPTRDEIAKWQESQEALRPKQARNEVDDERPDEAASSEGNRHEEGRAARERQRGGKEVHGESAEAPQEVGRATR